jgi:hypothetical protein
MVSCYFEARKQHGPRPTRRASPTASTLLSILGEDYPEKIKPTTGDVGETKVRIESKDANLRKVIASI